MDWKRTKLVSSILRLINPGYSYCEKCGLPWNHCQNKTVRIHECQGTFSTCDVCWNNSTLEELKGYYTKVYLEQKMLAIRHGYEMEHSLEHLLNCVEAEYLKTRVKDNHLIE